MTTATMVVIAVGLIGTVILSLVALNHWGSLEPKRGKRATTPATTCVAITQKKFRFRPAFLIPPALVLTLLTYVVIDKPKRPTYSQLPADVALPIIAQCESGGRQFDDRGNLIKNPTSSAIGKYQIMASLHEERAKGLGYDIRTLEGNEGYARYLYAESGTQHWEAEPRSRRCWAPKLMALGQGVPPRLGARRAEAAEIKRQPVAKNLSRHWQKRGEGDPKYCWTTTRGPRHRYSDPIQVFPATSPTETGRPEKVKKLVCVW